MGIAKRTQIYWLCQFAGWFAYSGFWLVPSLYAGLPMVPLIELTCLGTLISIGWTHIDRLAVRRLGWTALSPAKLAPRMLVSSLVVAMAISLSGLPATRIIGGVPGPLTVWLMYRFAVDVTNVFLWNVVYFGVHYFERWRQAERDKLELAVAAAEAKLHSLMSQLNPHFFFNCLNSVRALIVEDPGKAHTSVTALSKLMRYTLQSGQVATVPLEAELEMVTTYLTLEGIRFEDRLRCEIAIAAETRGVPVPPMLVQALVENGVKHGIERLPRGGTIGVSSWLEPDALRVRVTNTGRIVACDDSTSVGLHNARERLRLIYGARASLTMREDAGTVIAELSVPLAGAPAGATA
jgi:two-component system LytT family sensor kinase